MSVVLFDSVTFTVEVAFASAPGAAVPTWTDITQYVISCSTQFGRNDVLQQTTTGTATLVLQNNDRRFDPTYTGGAYYPNVLPMKRIRIRATYSATTYDLFTGFIEGWPQDYQYPSVSTVTVTASDLQRVLAEYSYTPPSAVTEYVTSDVVTAVLDAVGWPAGTRQVSTGQSVVRHPSVNPVSALTLLRNVADAEQGRFYVDGAGNAVFRSRAWCLTDTTAKTSQGTFGELEIPYRDVSIDDSGSYLYNTITFGSTSASDATSITNYFRRDWSSSGGAYLVRPEERSVLSAWLLRRWKDPTVRVRSLLLAPRASPTTMFPQALGRKIGERITVVRRPQSVGSAISQPVIVESVGHQITASNWVTTWTTGAVWDSGSTYATYDDGTYDDFSYAP